MKRKCIILLTTITLLSGAKYIHANKLEVKDETVYINQLEEKNKLLIEALDNFGASSKEQAIEIYAEGVKTRSGPKQYSVMCKNLKEDFIKTMEEDENYAWVTGFSSPWVKEYKVVEDKKNKDNSYTVVIKFSWETGGGPFGETNTTLTLVNENEIWCITHIEKTNNW